MYQNNVNSIAPIEYFIVDLEYIQLIKFDIALKFRPMFSFYTPCKIPEKDKKGKLARNK